jgi:hypothetical protein
VSSDLSIFLLDAVQGLIWKDLERTIQLSVYILFFGKTGARVGHRSLMRYYKQRFGLSRAVAVAKNQKAVGRVLQQYRALGWTGSTGTLMFIPMDQLHHVLLKRVG